MDVLTKCPCGETPTVIVVLENGHYGSCAFAVPDCCDEWAVQFNTEYQVGIALKPLAVRAWNKAKRK